MGGLPSNLSLEGHEDHLCISQLIMLTRLKRCIAQPWPMCGRPIYLYAGTPDAALWCSIHRAIPGAPLVYRGSESLFDGSCLTVWASIVLLSNIVAYLTPKSISRVLNEDQVRTATSLSKLEQDVRLVLEIAWTLLGCITDTACFSSPWYMWHHMAPQCGEKIFAACVFRRPRSVPIRMARLFL